MMMTLAVVVAFVSALLVARQICDPASWLHILDHPNERSLHTRPVPRTGGIAILAGVTLSMLVYGAVAILPAPVGWIGAATVIVAVMSFIDDRQGLSVSVRLTGQLVGAGLAVAGGLSLRDPGLPGADWLWTPWVGMVVSLIYLVWMINLYNFMDGMDGFAGGMAVIGFGSFAALGALAGHPAFLVASLAIAAAAAGFVVFNFPPARIFMGDSGSATLGLLAGSLSLWGARDGVFPFWVAMLVFAPFVVDATATLIRRLLRRERVWEAHKTHYYQRLVQLGWGHRKTVLAEYGLMLACGVSAVVASRLTAAGQWFLIAGWCLVYVVLILGVSRLERAATE